MKVEDWFDLDRAPPLRPNEVHVWRAGLTCDAPGEATLSAILSDDERARAGRFVQPRDRRRFIVARGRLRQLLGNYLGLSPVHVRLLAGPFGKPHLAEATSSIKFNVAHSDELALFAFAPGGEVGIDLEFKRPGAEFSDLARRFFSTAESAALSAIGNSEERRHAFFRCWTRKEAYLKALGKGLQVPLDGFTVTVTDAAALVQTAHDTWQRDRWQLEDLAPAAGFAAALCVEGRGWRVRRATCAGFG
jgi:4'-phosphopantetheinyl transferase